MGLGANLANAATSGLAGAVTGGIGSIVSGGLGLLGGLFKRNNNGLKNQQKLMQQAWEYEKEGMGLQYNYGQQAADAEYRRNLQMWKDTNFGAQRDEMEKAGLSVGLMYGNGGGSAASTAGGTATQPNAPKTNPVEVALQQESMGLQLKQIEAQNRLANAEATKTIAEANKIAGVDTKGQELQNKWQEIENRIQTSRESIEQSNMKAAAANADKAVEDWKMAVLDREYLDKTQEDRVTRLVSEIAKIQKEGSLAESATDVNYQTARKIEKEIENFYYEMITRRMSAEAAKETAENMLKKIENEYKLGSDQNLREWIYGGVDRINGILETIMKFKNGAQILETIKKRIKK
jgi:predicted  nucleic acid-binding Zn-ribbon protein